MQKLINKRSIVIDYLMMIVGTGLLAAAIQCLYDPIGLVTGGFTGLAIVIKADRKICSGRNPTLADQYRAECATVFSDSEV